METPLSYILRRLVWYATCSVSIEHIEQQSNRATEHSVGYVTQRSAILAAGRDERRRYLTFCLRPYYTGVTFRVAANNGYLLHATQELQKVTDLMMRASRHGMLEIADKGASS